LRRCSRSREKTREKAETFHLVPSLSFAPVRIDRHVDVARPLAGLLFKRSRRSISGFNNSCSGRTKKNHACFYLRIGLQHTRSFSALRCGLSLYFAYCKIICFENSLFIPLSGHATHAAAVWTVWQKFLSRRPKAALCCSSRSTQADVPFGKVSYYCGGGRRIHGRLRRRKLEAIVHGYRVSHLRVFIRQWRRAAVLRLTSGQE
jgi:hypothetical protein